MVIVAPLRELAVELLVEPLCLLALRPASLVIGPLLQRLYKQTGCPVLTSHYMPCLGIPTGRVLQRLYTQTGCPVLHV